MTRAVSFARAPASLWTVAVALWGNLAGCSTSAPSTAYTPITGIQIPSAELVAGHGCGNGGHQQVYKYAAVIAYSDAGPGEDGGGAIPGALTSAVFDCFADGIFSNLPQSDAGNSSFAITIYAYNLCSFPPQLACSLNAATACAAEDASVVAQSVA